MQARANCSGQIHSEPHIIHSQSADSLRPEISFCSCSDMHSSIVIPVVYDFNSFMKKHDITGEIEDEAYRGHHIEEAVCSYIAKGIPCSEWRAENPSDHDLHPRTPRKRSNKDSGLLVAGHSSRNKHRDRRRKCKMPQTSSFDLGICTYTGLNDIAAERVFRDEVKCFRKYLGRHPPPHNYREDVRDLFREKRRWASHHT